MTRPWLDHDLTTVAFCWRLDRRDGVSIGFTSHDRDLMLDGMRYRATPGMVPGAITMADDLATSTMDLAGAISSDAITEPDLIAGRWDGARMRLYAIDWEQPDADKVLLVDGALGDIAVNDGAFSAELRGPTRVLEVAVVEYTSPDCRASLGDGRCRVDPARLESTARIATVIDGLSFAVDALATTLPLAFGAVRWLSGQNCGLRRQIVMATGTTITLRSPPPYPVAAGDRISITAGCDKTFAMCRTVYANAANFRGEPHLPGNDLLTRYPGAS